MNSAYKNHKTLMLTRTIRMRRVRDRKNIKKVLSLYHTQFKQKYLKTREKRYYAIKSLNLISINITENNHFFLFMTFKFAALVKIIYLVKLVKGTVCL